MTQYNKYIFILFFSLTFISLNINAQEVRVIDNKGTIQTVNKNKVYSQDADPTTTAITPVENDVWYDTDDNLFYIWDATANWLEITSTSHTGTTGSVFFAGATGTPSEDVNQFFWNNTSKRLYIGSPLAGTNKLNVNGTIRTSGLNNADGTFGLPSYRFYDDSDTGMYRITNNQLGFSTNGINALSIDASQNINIPQNLSVAGTYIDSSGDVGTSGQILSSTNTGTNWINNNTVTTNNTGTGPTPAIEGDIWFDTLNNEIKIYDTVDGWKLITSTSGSGNFYTTNGTLTTNRTVTGAGLGTALTFSNINGFTLNSINSNVYNAAGSNVFSAGSSTTITSAASNVFTSTAATQLRSTNDVVEIFGNSGIDLLSNTDLTGNLSVTGTYADSDGDVGTNGQILSSTATGTNWIDNAALNNWLITGNTGTTAANFLGTIDTQDLVLRTNNTERLRVTSDRGQLRINQAPIFNNHPLVIRANGVDVLAFQDASGVPRWHWNLLADGLNFVESNVLDYRLFLQNGGNVGINIGTPSERLDVNGRLRVRTIDDGDITTDKVIVADANGVLKKVEPSFHTIGDIKNGVQPTDHSGWYVLDGRTTGGLSTTAQAAAATLGFGGNLPDATNRVLKHPNGGQAIGDTGGQINTTLIQANLPNITFPAATTNNNGNHRHTIPRTVANARAQWNSDNNLRSYSNGANTNTSTTGNHTHNVTVSSGGSDQSFERYQPYLVVNTFIYLGL